jgi:RNA polymerase sigma-70 factor (ECF subfamily)
MIDVLSTSAAPLDAAGIAHAQVRRLYALIYSKVGNREAAEGLTAAVIVTALRRLNATPPEHGIAAWLDRAAHNAATDYWRQGRGRARVPLEHERTARTQAPAPDATCQEHATDQARTLLNRLPEIDRAVLSYRIVEGLSVAETAQRLGIGEAQVKVVQYQALTRAAQLRMGDVTATQPVATGTKEGDHDASIQSRPTLCGATPT